MSDSPKRVGLLSRMFGRKGTSTEVPVLTDVIEDGQVKEKVDKLTAKPREMVLPELAPEEHVLGEGATAPEITAEPVSAKSALGELAERLPFKRGKVDQPLAADELQVNRPIRLLVGYVPDVTEKDARFFAAGVAEKNVDSEYISYLGLFRYQTGYAYEIQEGGHGRSYLEPIIRYYEGLPPGKADKDTAVFIATGQRMVQIEKSAEGGLICVQLPESYKAKETEWLVPTKKLKLMRDLNTGFMMAAGAFLGVSLIALIAAYATRYQPYEAPPVPEKDKVSIEQLPSQHWFQVQSPAPGQYVKKWEFSKGRWHDPDMVSADTGAKVSGAAESHAKGASPVAVPAMPAPTPMPPEPPHLPKPLKQVAK